MPRLQRQEWMHGGRLQNGAHLLEMLGEARCVAEPLPHAQEAVSAMRLDLAFPEQA